MPIPTRAFIIHLPDDTRRIRNVKRLTYALQAAGVSHVEVVLGVRPQDRGPMYSVGEWGCYQSHLACLRRIAADPGAGSGLVLEDDAVLSTTPDDLRAMLSGTINWDFLHVGYLSNTVFRAWDADLLSREALRVRGVLYGLQCYAASPEGLAERCDALERLPFEPASEGGGVGADGALCELSWRDPSLVRLAPPRSLFHTLAGTRSSIRPTSARQRAVESTREAARQLKMRIAS